MSKKRWPQAKPLKVDTSHPNHRDEVHGFTPLHAAAQKGDHWIVEELLKAGADPMKKSYGGFTAGDLAENQRCRKLIGKYASRVHYDVHHL